MTRQARYGFGAVVGVAALLTGSAHWMIAHAQSGKAIPEPKGKITPWEAIKIAKGKVPGRALNANFEFDEGKWVYGVMIVANNTLQEVEIDPMTGKVGDVEKVTPEGEAKEMKAELTRALGGKVAGKAEEEKEETDEKAEKP